MAAAWVALIRLPGWRGGGCCGCAGTRSGSKHPSRSSPDSDSRRSTTGAGRTAATVFCCPAAVLPGSPFNIRPCRSCSMRAGVWTLERIFASVWLGPGIGTPTWPRVKATTGSVSVWAWKPTRAGSICYRPWSGCSEKSPRIAAASGCWIPPAQASCPCPCRMDGCCRWNGCAGSLNRRSVFTLPDTARHAR